MANTAKEKALKVIAKQIKDLDNSSFSLDVLDSKMELGSARANFFNIIRKNGYNLTKDHKIVKLGTK